MFPELEGFRPWLVEPAEVSPVDDGSEPFHSLYPANRGSPSQLSAAEALLVRGENQHPLEDAWVPATWVANIIREGEITLAEDTHGSPVGGIAQDATGDWASPLPAGTTVQIVVRPRGWDPGSARILYNGKLEKKWTREEQRVLSSYRDAKRKLNELQWWVDAAAAFPAEKWARAEARWLK